MPDDPLEGLPPRFVREVRSPKFFTSYDQAVAEIIADITKVAPATTASSGNWVIDPEADDA